MKKNARLEKIRRSIPFWVNKRVEEEIDRLDQKAERLENKMDLIMKQLIENEKN